MCSDKCFACLWSEQDILFLETSALTGENVQESVSVKASFKIATVPGPIAYLPCVQSHEDF